MADTNNRIKSCESALDNTTPAVESGTKIWDDTKASENVGANVASTGEISTRNFDKKVVSDEPLGRKQKTDPQVARKVY